jgi:GAF domain-containing protein
MEELRLGRSDLDAQIEELAKRDGFRRQYTSNMLSGILHSVMEGTRADLGNIQLYDRTESRLTIYVQHGFGRPFLAFFDSVHSGQAACGMALEAGRRVVVSDVTDSPIFCSTDILEVLLDAGVRSVQSTPLVGESGTVLGMLSTHYRTVRNLARRDLQLVDHFAARAAVIIEWQNRRTLCHTEPPPAGHSKAL